MTDGWSSVCPRQPRTGNGLLGDALVIDGGSPLFALIAIGPIIC